MPSCEDREHRSAWREATLAEVSDELRAAQIILFEMSRGASAFSRRDAELREKMKEGRREKKMSMTMPEEWAKIPVIDPEDDIAPYTITMGDADEKVDGWGPCTTISSPPSVVFPLEEPKRPDTSAWRKHRKDLARRKTRERMAELKQQKEVRK